MSSQDSAILKKNTSILVCLINFDSRSSADSLLCLGGIGTEPVQAWESRI